MKVFFLHRSDAMGDLLLTLPLVGILKALNPGCHIVVGARSAFGAIVNGYTAVDELYVVSEDSHHKFSLRNLFSFSFWRQLWQMKKQWKRLGVTDYIHFGGDHRCNFLAWWLGVPYRGGVQSQWPSFLFLRQGLRQKRSQVLKHEAEYNLDLVKKWMIDHGRGEEVATHAQWMDLWRQYFSLNLHSDKKEEKIKKEMNEEREDEPDFKNRSYLVVHPGMRGHTLNWPMEYYARLVKGLLKKYPQHHIVFSFTSVDESYKKEFLERFSLFKKEEGEDGRFHFWNGDDKGLAAYIHLLAHAQMFIGPSTGTLHLANALGIPLVGFYSPIPVQSPARWRPFPSQPHHMIFTPPPSAPCPERFHCAGKTCPYYDCMTLITVEQVLHEMNDKFKKLRI
jgi:ADP-heptose:LPS heptosyltransferase